MQQCNVNGPLRGHVVKYETQKTEENKRQSHTVGIAHVDHVDNAIHLLNNWAQYYL